MKLIYAFLATLILFSCSSTKKIVSTEKTVKESILETKSIKDSVTEIVKTKAIENFTEFNIDDLAKQVGDFKNYISSGPGSEFIIEKKGNKLKITSKTPETISTTTSVSEIKEEFRYDSEYIEKELKTLIRRIPFKIYLFMIIGLIIFFRKFLVRIIVLFFPVMASKKIIYTILGSK